MKIWNTRMSHSKCSVESVLKALVCLQQECKAGADVRKDVFSRCRYFGTLF